MCDRIQLTKWRRVLRKERFNMQRYQVQIPQGVGPGQPFIVNVAGQQMRVTCPANARAGSMIEIQAPAAGGTPPPPQQQHAPPPPQQQQYAPPPPQQQQQGYAPPPPAPVPGSAPVGKALAPQCAASLDAERRLAQGGPPDAGLIFTAMDRDGSNSVEVHELQHGLSQGGRMKFSIKTCQLLINIYDKDGNGEVNRNEFLALWGYLDQWRACFDAHDRDKSGSISKEELKAAIQQVGYRFSEPFYEKLMRIYSKTNHGQVGFDEFIQVFCELHNLTEAFKKFDKQQIGKAEFMYEEFLNAAYSIHT
uniref:EF-hand domain-containing protein n=1 Tax=Mucochytrium quahogii TaxID=96639 RepID=A0A7S2R7U5_9STRA|mmetsp:Transcript_22723/g.36211  ORF Transcript_22723/g.36211 Transcript_22723/m.36211 type:complete len:306 (+) Transcript_22723:1123-2040(+)